MKKLLFVLPILIMTVSCNAQQKNKEKAEKHGLETQQDKPQVNWKVNKKYDDKGNLIAYDSTYTWSYSTKDGKMSNIAADSVMSAFKKQFNTEFPSLFKEGFGNPVWTDSLFYRDFNDHDYFMKKWQNHYFDMNKMMRQMDSLRNSFLNNNYPGLNIQKKKL